MGLDVEFEELGDGLDVPEVPVEFGKLLLNSVVPAGFGVLLKDELGELFVSGPVPVVFGLVELGELLLNSEELGALLKALLGALFVLGPVPVMLGLVELGELLDPGKSEKGPVEKSDGEAVVVLLG